MNYDDSFEANLFKHISDKKTGTILIVTKNNKSCQVTLEAGEIVAVTMGRVKGYAAGPELFKGRIKKASFNSNIVFPHTKDAFISSTRKFTNLLKSVSAVVESEAA